jgi:hypothetical protein
MFYPIESRQFREPDGSEPVPEFEVGMEVRLRGKPEKIRKILEVSWHFHRYRYCYKVETSTSDRGCTCPAYWFIEQFDVADTMGERKRNGSY